MRLSASMTLCDYYDTLIGPRTGGSISVLEIYHFAALWMIRQFHKIKATWANPMSTTVNILSNDDGYLDALAQVNELGNLFVLYTEIFNMFGIFLHFSNTSSMHLWV